MRISTSHLRNDLRWAERDNLEREVNPLSSFELLKMQILLFFSEWILELVFPCMRHLTDRSSWRVVSQPYTWVRLLQCFFRRGNSRKFGSVDSVSDFVNISNWQLAVWCRKHQTILSDIEIRNTDPVESSIKLEEVRVGFMRVFWGIEYIFFLGEPECTFSIKNEYMFPSAFDL